MPERIDVLLGVQTHRGTRNIVLDGGSPSPTARESGFDAAVAKLLEPSVRCSANLLVLSLSSLMLF